MPLNAAIARTCINPFWGVELTGWGYYLNRTWLRIHDDLHATSLVVSNGDNRLVIVSLDLMVIGAEFTREVRRQITAATNIPATNILVCCQHTHNSPASQGLLGVGDVDREYEAFAARQAATSAIMAFRELQPARLSAATTTRDGLTYNRTRANGPIDPTLTTLCVDRIDGSTLAFVVGYQGHPTVATVLRPRDVSRDVPGEVCDRLETAFPGSLAIYLQGACGDVNIHPHFTTPERCHEPAEAIANAAIASLTSAEELEATPLGATSNVVRLPTRRWTRDEIEFDRGEALRRLRDRDTNGWRETIGRAMTNRPDDMVTRHGGDEWKAVEAMCRFNIAWTDLMLRDLDQRPEWLETEVQALRIGEFGIAANSSEFFSNFALDLRDQSPVRHLALACYANGRIGYIPDAHDIERKTYAAYQSPKYCNQFPFTEDTGPTMVQAMREALSVNGIRPSTAE